MSEFDPNVETSVDPLALTYGATGILESLALYLRSVEDWRAGVRDPEIRSKILGQLAYCGDFLARITELVTDPPDPLIAEARADIMQAALDVVVAGVRSARREDAPPAE